VVGISLRGYNDRMITTFSDPNSPYRQLARSLDALPNRFPPAQDESELRLLEKLFSEDEAEMAANLLPTLESVAFIATRLQRDPKQVKKLLKGMVRKGLINMGKTPEGRVGFGLMPFVVGFYEEQGAVMDIELAQLFEDYFKQVFGQVLKVEPQLHRVIPVGETVRNDMEVHPFESVSALIDQAQSWGLLDCICRKQKALIGDACQHPVDICMALSPVSNAFIGNAVVRALTHAEAMQALRRAAQAGLVHCVSNRQQGMWYICNCCMCSCGILRGMAELGIANAVARSAFINQVDDNLCAGCGDCVSACQFSAIAVNGVAQVSDIRCIGCGLCVTVCPQEALGLVRRLDEVAPPLDSAEWGKLRQAAR
jgi:electron transport complex protein RnfB